ncbi:MAG: Rieske 2Fe-2S domain-containing protein [Rhodospirillaceae bacterium]|nr:Rieske 2Fe-2S domain-containing protein [Rhodospirillaceae bacterium]
MLSIEDNETLCRVGPGTPMGNLFRRFWLPALLSREVAEPDGAPKRLRILSEDLVAFRDTGGRVGIVAAYCPHKLAMLFWGRNEEHGLRCAYHGWKFDADGYCVDLPNVADADTIKRKMGITSYPTREAGGVVWVYMGPDHLEPELPALEWTELPEPQVQVSRWLQCSNWAQGMEGEIDSSHVSFLHRANKPEHGLPDAFTSYLPGLIDGAPELTVKETPYGYVAGARRQTDQPGEYFWRVTQWLVPMFSLIANSSYPRSGRAWVPVDDDHVTTFGYMFNAERPFNDAELAELERGTFFPPRMTPGAHRLPNGYIIDTFLPDANSGNDYLIDRDIQTDGNYTGIFGVNEQDRCIQETLPAAEGNVQGSIVDRSRERLVASDVPVITARRILLDLARALEAGIEPTQAGQGDLYAVRSLAATSPHREFEPFLDAFHTRVMTLQPE